MSSALARRDRGGVVVAGAAGVGKSRLVVEALSVAEARGFLTASATATAAAASIPFGALAHLLPRRWSPAPGNVLREAADAVLKRSGRARLVMGVDDGHLLDGHSAALLHHMTVRGEAQLILAVRTGEPVPDPLTGLWKDGPCDRLDLQPLSREETGELLEAALTSQVQATTTHRLWQLTRGNPLFLREVVLGALEDGSLSMIRGVWRWTAADTSYPSYPRLHEVLGSRLGGLDDDERELMEVTALGEPLELVILGAMAGPELVDRLVRRGLLEETSRQRRVAVRPSHPLYAEILRSGVSPSRARAIHGRLATALEETGVRRAEDLLRLAGWCLEAGVTDRPALYLDAAEQALALFDYPLGRRLAEAAIEAGAGPQANELLARALIGVGRFQAADDLLARMVAEAEDDASRIRTAITRTHNLAWDLGRVDEGLHILTQAEAVVTDAGLRAELTASRSHLLAQSGRLDEAIAVGCPVLDHPTVSGRAVVEAVGGAGIGLLYSGRPEQALQLLGHHLDRLLPALRETMYGPFAPVAYRTMAYVFAGRLRQAVTEAERAYGETLERGPDWAAGFVGGLLGVALRAQGRARSASRLLSQGVAPLRETNVGGQLLGILAELAHTLALQGDADGAQEALREAEAARQPGVRFLEGWLRLPRTWITVARGEVSQAAAHAIELAEALGSVGMRSQQAVALHDAARLGEAGAVGESLARLSGVCDGRLIATFARHAQALATRDAPVLNEVSTGFEEMGAFLLAAEAAAEASRLHEHAGARRDALAAAARATTLVAMCEGTTTPALADLAEPLPLTRREREVAGLAGRGLSDQEIADRLVISIRTVGNHLHRAYAKLGIGRRDEIRGIRGLT
jgi:DNA-binding CsgD family transcriptional regulator